MQTVAAYLPLDALRAEFSGLGSRVWLNCQGIAPGARSVTAALRGVLRDWEDGSFDWARWEAAAESARAGFARLIGAPPDDVALLASLADAAATVATALRSRPHAGRRRVIVVGEGEFRSNLFPWLALEAHGFSIRLLDMTSRPLAAGRMAGALDRDVALLAVSDVQSQTGARIDLPALAGACRAAGVQLFVNLTQSAGILRFDASVVQPDYVAAHSYKWMLAPRGASFLYARPALRDDMLPLAPNWKNGPAPYERMYGGPLEWSASARRLDASLAWHSWVGADAALRLLARFDPVDIESQALDLAGECRAALVMRGARVAIGEMPSQLVGVRFSTPDAAQSLRLQLHDAGVEVSARGPWLRVGFHGFNTATDLQRLLDGLPNRL